MESKDKNLTIASLASAAVHGVVVALGCLNIFQPHPSDDMFLNIELAGAAEMQQAIDDYNNRPPSPTPPEISPAEEQKTVTNEPTEPEVEQPQPEVTEPTPPEPVIEEQLVKGPSMIEPQPTEETESEPEPELDESFDEEGEALPKELQDQEALQLEREKLEKEKQEKIRKEKEEKRRLEKKRREEKLKKKKEAERKRKKRLEAIKRLEKKNKAKKNRLAKIAEAVKKNNDEKKKKKNNAFDQMLKSEKKNIENSSYGRFNGSLNGNGMGNGNGLGSYGDGMGFTDSDAAIISSQIIPHWVVAGGVKNAETLIIRIRIKVKDNGEVPASSIEILDKDRYNSDHVFKSAADSAKRAILKASPLKIPADKIHLFRDFEFSFNTDKALGVRK